MTEFAIGQEYPRSSLLEFLGSKQQQAGVLWGTKEPGCLVVTSGGRHGKKMGYADQRLDDGCWWYFGQGGSGDHSLANSANAKLAAGALSVLLFTTREPTASEVRARGSYGKAFAFQGEFNVAGYETVHVESGARIGDRLMRFLLVPCEQGLAIPPRHPAGEPIDLHALRRAIGTKTGPAPTSSKMAAIEYRERSSSVRLYALLRARGKCEGCGSAPPFVDDYGQGFFEVHHILRLADDGADEPQNVAALCPNCHRRAHYAADRAAFRVTLSTAVQATEALLADTDVSVYEGPAESESKPK
jgi:5-methylcytosine-specific restriction protein A